MNEWSIPSHLVRIPISIGPVIGAREFHTYSAMCTWLLEYAVEFRFWWKDTGKYMPDAVYLDAESAVVFKLIFGA